MSEDEAAYEEEADFYEEDEENLSEIEEEESDEENENEDPEAEYQDEELEIDELEQKYPPIQKIDENDKNHRMIKVIPDDQKVSSHIIQYSEMVEAIGIRISQIENGSPILTDYSGYKNSIDIAKKEFIDRKNPLILTRELKRKENLIEVERWKVREMTFPVSDREILDLTQIEVNKLLK
jgi:hypothetical protein